MLVIISTIDKNNKKLSRAKRTALLRKKKLKFLLFIGLISILGIFLIVTGYNSIISKNLALSKSSNDFDKNALTICIDPGHGDWDDGATGIDGSLEKNINLDVSLKLGTLLKNAGFNVVYTRDSDDLTLSDDELKNLCERVDISKENNADLFISIHCNTTDESSSYKGVETWYNPKDANNETFANYVQTELVSLDYSDDRGIKSDSELVVLDRSVVPSVLVELGFVSNSSDESFLNSNSGQAKCAEALFNAIKNAADELYPEGKVF